MSVAPETSLRFDSISGLQERHLTLETTGLVFTKDIQIMDFFKDEIFQ